MLIANGLRKVDMQDLLVFLQVHQRQNLVEVAEQLNLSPSTVSYCLKKLRQAFDDELFIATRGGMQPTHKSRAMLPHVEEMLARINACHAAQGSFDPRGEPRTFTLCVQDRAQPRHERLELDEFCRRRFVFPTPLDASNANLVDTWLRRQGRSREVAARANSYVAALQLLSGSDFVLMLPRRIHALLDDGRHRACLAPSGLPPFALHLSWSRAADQDPANLWLREQVLIVCAELGLL